MDYEQAEREYAAKMGWSWPLKPKQHLQAVRAIRPKKQLARDVVSAIESRVATGLRLRVLPQEIVDLHTGICQNCPDKKYQVMANGQPVCMACSCSDKWLTSKIRDPKQKCVRGHWDNQEALRRWNESRGAQ